MSGVFPVNSVAQRLSRLRENGEGPQPLVYAEDLVEVTIASDVVLKVRRTYNRAEVALFLV